MSDPSSVLLVSRYYWPELIRSAPFSTDIAQWLPARSRPPSELSPPYDSAARQTAARKFRASLS